MEIMSYDQLMSLPEPEWAIDNIVPEEGLVIIRGKFASMKTFLALDWASCIATGKDWQGHTTRSAEILYMIGESPKGVVKRLNAWAEAFNKGEKLPGWWSVRERPDLTDARKVNEMEQALERINAQPRLFLIDTLARHFGSGDENSTKDMNAFVAGCDSFRDKFPGATLVMIHHVGKDERKGSRGNSALEGAADTIIEVKKDDRSKSITLTCAKQKDSEEFAPITLGWKPVGSSIVLVSRDEHLERREDQKADQQQEKALAVLMCYPNGMTLRQWREKCSFSGTTINIISDKLLLAEKVRLRSDNTWCPA